MCCSFAAAKACMAKHRLVAGKNCMLGSAACSACCIPLRMHAVECILNLNVAVSADKLQQLGHNVQISHSAGRYLCNYIYFRSLQHCTTMPNWHAVFVHVPPVKFLDEDGELEFALDLFDQLAHQVQATVPELVVA